MGSSLDGLKVKTIKEAVAWVGKDEFFIRPYHYDKDDLPWISQNGDHDESGRLIMIKFGEGLCGWKEGGKKRFSLLYPDSGTLFELNKLRLLEEAWKKELLQFYNWKKAFMIEMNLPGKPVDSGFYERPETYRERENDWIITTSNL